jgi:hypothetical protein
MHPAPSRGAYLRPATPETILSKNAGTAGTEIRRLHPRISIRPFEVRNEAYGVVVDGGHPRYQIQGTLVQPGPPGMDEQKSTLKRARESIQSRPERPRLLLNKIRTAYTAVTRFEYIRSSVVV